MFVVKPPLSRLNFKALDAKWSAGT